MHTLEVIGMIVLIILIGIVGGKQKAKRKGEGEERSTFKYDHGYMERSNISKLGDPTTVVGHEVRMGECRATEVHRSDDNNCHS